MTTARMQLTRALSHGAQGDQGESAAVLLLMRHGRWMGRADFHAYIHTDGDAARVDWGRAIGATADGTLPCSSSEAAMLRVCASLAGHRAVVLGDELRRMGTFNIEQIARVIDGMAV